ncbi:hypothetical protein MUK42_15689, partial [Musa troglodytarum]
PKHTEIINPALPFVPWYYLPWKSGRIPGQLETKASTPSRFVTFSLFLFFPLSLQSLESELAVTGNGTEISDFLLYLCSDAMLTRRGGWELSSSASFCAALLLLHVAVVLPGGSLTEPQELQTHRHLPVANLEWCFSSSSSF